MSWWSFTAMTMSSEPSVPASPPVTSSRSSRRGLGELPYALGIAAGIDSGNVIEGGIGAKVASRVDYTVVGAVVSRAARLTARAQRDEILISAEAFAAIAKHFEAEKLRLDPNDGRPIEVDALRVTRRLVDEAPHTGTETVFEDTADIQVPDASIIVPPRLASSACGT